MPARARLTEVALALQRRRDLEGKSERLHKLYDLHNLPLGPSHGQGAFSAPPGWFCVAPPLLMAPGPCDENATGERAGT